MYTKFGEVNAVPRVTIAMPVYNSATTLKDAVTSILSQTYKDFELIICDDGSNDETLAIASRFADEDGRVFVLKNPENFGLNVSLNSCLKITRGEFYARMDGDDISMPNRLEKLVAALDASQDIALISSWMTCFDDYGDWCQIKTKPMPNKNDFIYGTPFCHAPCIIRTSVLRELGGYGAEPWLRRSQDYHLWFRLYAAGYRGINLQESLYRMRNSREAASRRSLKTRLTEARIMWYGFRLLRLSPWYYIRIIRPILLGLMPNCMYERLHRWRRTRSS